MNVLALESSTDSASVSMHVGGMLMEEREFFSKRTLCAELFPVLWELLERVPAVDRIVVGLGPGSYAGVRIGIAAALGLQSVWGCELVGIPSVAAMGSVGESYRVVGDARRGSWYYSRVEGGVCVEGPLLIESEGELEKVLAGRDTRVLATEVLGGRWKAGLGVPRARILGQLAGAELGIVQREQLEPLYLREPHITGKVVGSG